MYRHFGVDDRLAHVGVADDVARRLAQHRVRASWWPEVVRVEFQCYPSRDTALQAEAIAITVEKPRRNALTPRVREERQVELSVAEQTRLVQELERARADARAARTERDRAERARDSAQRRLQEAVTDRDWFRKRYWEQARHESEACVQAFIQGRDEPPAEWSTDGDEPAEWSVDWDEAGES
ncbi:MAG: hypothetical protein KF727_14450 [Microbacteriaceae bacterium]|nr:hypothetical protein [Microbacteriaceae bacterium]